MPHVRCAFGTRRCWQRSGQRPKARAGSARRGGANLWGTPRGATGTPDERGCLDEAAGWRAWGFLFPRVRGRETESLGEAAALPRVEVLPRRAMWGCPGREHRGALLEGDEGRCFLCVGSWGLAGSQLCVPGCGCCGCAPHVGAKGGGRRILCEWESPRGASSARSSEAGAAGVAGCSLCVSGPVAQPWSRSAPTGMRLLSAPRAAPAPHGSGRQEKRREGKGEGEKEKKNPRASNLLSPNSASDKGQFIPSLSRGGKRGAPDKPGSPRPPPEPPGCAWAGCACPCVWGQGSQEHPHGRGLLCRGGRLYPLGVHCDWCHGDRKPLRGAFPNRTWLPSPGKGCQALSDLPNTTLGWEEDKLSRERNRHGNRAELIRLARSGKRCQNPGCPASAGGVNFHPCSASRLPGAAAALSARAVPALQVTVTKQPHGSSSKKRVGGPTWEIAFHLLCPRLSAKERDLGENVLLRVEKIILILV